MLPWHSLFQELVQLSAGRPACSPQCSFARVGDMDSKLLMATQPNSLANTEGCDGVASQY